MAGVHPNSSVSQRFLIVTDLKDSSQVVLRQAGTHEAAPGNSQRPMISPLLGACDDLFDGRRARIDVEKNGGERRVISYPKRGSER